MPTALVCQKTHTFFIFLERKLYLIINVHQPHFLFFIDSPKILKKDLSTSGIFIIKHMCPYITCFLFNDDDH